MCSFFAFFTEKDPDDQAEREGSEDKNKITLQIKQVKKEV